MTNALGDLAEKTEGDLAEREKRAEGAQQKHKRPLPQWSRRYIRAVGLLLGVIIFAPPITLILQIWGIEHFLLPSRLSLHFLMSAVALVGLPLAFMWWMLRTFQFPSAGTSEELSPGNRWIGAPLLFALCVAGALTLLGNAEAYTVGGPTSVIVTVGDPHPSYVRRVSCSGEIDLKDRWFYRLCGQPDSLRNALHPGDKLRVSGTGTAWGLFYDRVTPVHG